MLVKNRRSMLLTYSFLLVVAVIFTGCASHLEKGWEHYQKGMYKQAQGEWLLEKEEDLSEQIGKAEAAVAIVELNGKSEQAKTAGDYQKLLRYSMGIVEKDKWDNKDWLEKSPILKEYIDNAHIMVEEAYYGILLQHKEQKYWVDLKKEYEEYEEYCSTYSKEPSERNTALYQVALDEIKKRASTIAAFDEQLECGKEKFLNEEYDEAMICLNKASGYVDKYPNIKFNTDELEYVMQSTEQAMRIKKAMEEEKQRMAEEERIRIEEANRLAAEAERKLEEERRRQEEEKIKLARAAERERLIKQEEERRKEAERQRKIDERNRRWRAFLKKGAPLKPLVTTVLKPSYGTGKLKMGEKEKWQGGSKLPKPKDKTIASEDVYALEVEVPKTHKLTYLRNYYKKNKREKNMLAAPKTQGGKRSYYTENFKGGRYYVEIKNEKSKQQKYEIKSRIYKIPVTH